MKIAICDDNKQEQEYCKTLLENLAQVYQKELEISLYAHGKELLFQMCDIRNYPDILYLDMKMEGMTGDEVAKELRVRGCNSEIIFYTVSKNYYSPAFDVKAFHYIVKGETTKQKFTDIFLQAIKAVDEKKKDYILFSGVDEYRSVEIKKIRYFQVAKRIITVQYNTEDEFVFYSTIGKIENRLMDFEFVRIHRSYLVALAWIRSISYQEVILTNQEVLPVGRVYYLELKKAMEEYLLNH